jgi:hypothetical protein
VTVFNERSTKQQQEVVNKMDDLFKRSGQLAVSFGDMGKYQLSCFVSFDALG